MTITEAELTLPHDIQQQQSKHKVGSDVIPPILESETAKRKGAKKGKKARGNLDPEHIAKVRAEREAMRKSKQEAMLAQGLDPDLPPELQFIRRPLLALSKAESTAGFEFKIMTYNCLAQALIRRKLFPDSGEAVKWFRRSKVLLNEFKYYDSDVICLQEVDRIQFQTFWKEEFDKLGYDSQFHAKPSKNHGISILWKRSLFTMTDKMLIDYDKEISGNIPPRTTTNNVGLVLALKFSPKVLERFPNTRKSGIIVGTTHLFWHPFGTYERTRQCYIVLNKTKEFMHRVNVLQNNNDEIKDHWYTFFGGDFNSQPFDTPYLSMTSKPVKYSNRAKTVIECSTSYTFSKSRDGEEDAEDEEGGNIEKFGKDQPATPVPSFFDASSEQQSLVANMEKLHNSLDMRAISLYSVGYGTVHIENAGLDNTRGEPEISNWAHAWNGLLDYLFVIKSWDFSDKIQVDSLKKFEDENELKVKAFLKMPTKAEMGKFGHGQPHVGEYPSDHLSMICKLELKL
ncbi:hypothetical protein KAFR_0L01960 [Kazachstania africana CBS 2517]|uniref:Endonuclease/exonuclease/phosphatase domain-containing protein n=1 Tax=Kazachstania africana (strain ATCC 22294 / BCRC 22015 / CBS 2517 / CECT 1963 / NBRC 1671 / NRRL Y-8276) TaxID=1071382 RepID=H2B2F7_KAZAF|nr:hypothetical protein KAFR_0L01960 [Kazachstania africana CBS 2517]CCF60807.1 hypothetical protein KAFR_0L01960 [Kazachstania africana CBS 2517]